MRNAFALIAAVLAAASSIPYIIGIVRGRTKPDIVTWMTWSILTAIASAAAFAAHEPRTAFLTVGATCSTAVIVVLGFKYGTAKFTPLDIFCQIGAIAGLVCWLVFNSPLVGIVVPVCIDFIGALPTLRHSWDKPGEETWQTFFDRHNGTCVYYCLDYAVQRGKLALPPLFAARGWSNRAYHNQSPRPFRCGAGRRRYL